MTPEQFKPSLVRDKEYLRQLYSAESVPYSKRLLMFSSDQQLDTVLKLMHFISTGQMRLKKTHFDSFSKIQITFLKKILRKKQLSPNFLKMTAKTKSKLFKSFCL